ncbi:MAG: endonuclease/exonuclease/phosphatase family protein [Verrucomicrobia bacterium]|nr:endonuclease/exonuclease/phosphatase family protein [Verrucomicrobiota bacterium]
MIPLIALLLAILLRPATGSCSQAPAGSPNPVRESRLRAVTFNLRFASDKSPNSWAARRPVIKSCWNWMDADIVGTQEGLFRQIKDMEADLPGYNWIGLGRDGGSRGEFMAIFFKKRRFEVMEFDHFWLSDTPSLIASTNWGNTNRRMATWARFKDRRDGREFICLNTHLDHAIQGAREKGARLIRDRVLAMKPELPVLVLGDFNAEPDRESTYHILTHDGLFRDAWTHARTRRNEALSTFHDFRGAVPGSFRIDWILTRGAWSWDHAETVVFQKGGQFPSDHHPVLADLRW